MPGTPPLSVPSFHCLSFCQTCLDTSVPSVDDQIQGPPSSPVANPPPTSSTTYNIHDNLPPGWKVPGSTTKSRTTLILALSLVLAFFICFLIIGCLFWRKNKRRRRKDSDIEMKARKRRREQDDDGRDSMLSLEKEAKVKQKIWARATARWKANARYSARQRRGKRIISTTRVARSSSSSSLARIDETQLPPTNASPNISRRSSLSYAATWVGDATSSSHPSPPVVPTHNVPTPLTPNPLPPAYHLRVAAQQAHAPSEGGHPTEPLSPLAYTSSSNSPSDPSGASIDMSLPPQSIHVAHVATDDKTLLARLADLASAPPPDGANSSNDHSTTFHVSVPIWQDEELKDFGHGTYDSSNRSLPPSRCSSRSSSPAPLFPPPPSKGKMAAPAFYDYPYTFEDILVEPDPGPSAPPFEELIPVGEADLTASAPPLLDAEAAYYIESHASAPLHEWDANVLPASSEVIEPLHSDIPHTSDDTGSDSTEISSSHSIPLVQGPVASDGTPPCYHP
ncbi:hypothetical protein DXG03_008406 [Asterophora parasitica]|uniref:Uncharacterized protein n=1 Tax=Asterophora parasitica TaxID=117018 RepID=A0A9P7KEL6_9AGAR|nr:hypothetical protein DXG03_008406 [Asterophora parasitica]